MNNLFMTRKPLVAACAAVVLTGCLGGGGSGSSTPEFSSLVGGIQTLSNDPALVSGGDVLVEVMLADPANAGNVVVELNGNDVTSAFALRGEDRFIGLVDGLELGENTLLAFERDKPGSSAELVVTNHPSHGPIFSGPQLDPWICAQPSGETVEVTNPRTGTSANATARTSGLSATTDENCSIPAEVTYYYQPVAVEEEGVASTPCNFTFTGTNACFVPWDADNPPADAEIARFTNDRGDTVRSILAVERGAMNRGMYSLAVFHDPDEPHHPAEPQPGWNNKLVFTFGGSSGGSRFQTPPGSPSFNLSALEKGYMLVTSSLNDHGTNANHALGAETLMMLKEHIVETWGPIRYTVGTGGSGGAIVQLTMASSYPGLLDGLIPSLTYADALTNGIEISDCGIYNATGGYANSIPLLQRAATTLAYTGHSSSLHCSAWNLLFLPSGDPSRAVNCGSGFPDELVYDADTNPNGIRCAHPEHNVNLLGSRVDADGVTRALQPLDNVGVQYGLRALQNGSMTVERFVDLNANIGYFNIDQTRISGPVRREATMEGLENAYRSGMVTDGRYLANVPIIDVRYNEPGLDIHLNWRALSVRERLEQANGHADNQVIWGYNQNQVPTATISNEAFVTMDAWLEAMEADTSSTTLADKVLANKPSLATDRCLARVTEDGVAEVRDVGLFTPECPVQFGGSPRIVAGGPVAEDVLKCQLKPLDFASDDYRLAETGELITFTEDQQAQLRDVFSTGVCDWSRPGVAQELNPGWMSFADGPGGEPLELTWFQRP